MQREIFTEEHHAFRDMVRSFIAKEIEPFHEQWEKDGIVSRELWLAAGRQGLLGIDIDEEYGGGGNSDYRYYVVFDEETGPRRGHRPRLLRAQRHQRPVSRPARHRRAEASAGSPATAPARSSPRSP